MPTLTAQSLIDKAQILLQDTTEVRWTEDELLGWLNDGQREIAMLRPDEFSVVGNVTLVAGTKQTLPAAGLAVLRVIRNMGADGATPGRAIRQVPMEILDANVPDWHSKTAAATTLHAVVDPKMPKTFYVYPPAVANNRVEVLYVSAPADVATKASTITVDDVYGPALIDYMCYRAYLKDQDLTGNAERAALHRGLFEKHIGSKTQSDSAIRTSSVNVKG